MRELRDSSGKNLGPPSIQLGSLQVWVFGRQFPDAHDRWDGNWLNVAVHCGGDGASVWTSGSILDTVSFSEFRTGLRRIYETLAGDAVLESVEPEIRVQVSVSDSLGHHRVRVEINRITSENGHGHWFEFGVDQTYLPFVTA